jgi:DNA replication protein DnaC
MTPKLNGAITLVTGPPGSGKSTLAQALALDSLNRGDHVLWVDADYSFTPSLCPSLMNHLDRLWIHHPRDVEQTMSLCTALIARGTVQLVVIDPLFAIPCHPRRRHQIEGDHNRFVRNLQLACHIQNGRAVVISDLWAPRNRRARTLDRLSTLVRAAQHLQTDRL